MSLQAVCAAALASILLGNFISKRWFNPLTVFSIIWAGIALLYQLRLSEFQGMLSDDTYMILCVVIASFALFFLIGWLFRIKRKPATRTISRSYENLFGIWLVCSLLEVFYCGGVPVVWRLTGSSKTYMDYGIPSLHGLLCAMGIAIASIAFYTLLLKKGESGRRVRVERQRAVTVISVILLYYSLIISRQVIISIFLQCAVLFMIKRKLRIEHVLGVAVVVFVCIIAFGITGDFRTGYEAFIQVSKINAELPQLLSGFYWVYMYLTMTLANVNNLVSMGLDPSGIEPAVASIFPSVIRYAIGWTTQTKSFIVSLNFNVSGFFAAWYYGLGLPGVMVISGLYGFVGGVTFRRYNQLRDARSALMYSVALQIIALSFFVDMLFYLPNMFQFAIIALFFRPSRNASSCQVINEAALHKLASAG